MQYYLIYITTKNLTEARQIAKQLVQKRLVACCNIIPKIESIYHWQGQLVNDQEALLIAKTTKSKVKKSISEIKKIHSYKIPGLIAWEIKEGNQDFLTWIKKEVK